MDQIIYLCFPLQLEYKVYQNGLEKSELKDSENVNEIIVDK